jgi:protein-S-isoprenylcysteine O-methyltransferase Ste14
MVFRGLVRRQYRRQGYLRWWETLLQLLVFCGWASFSLLQYPAAWPDSDLPWVVQAVGWTLLLGGLGSALVAGVHLGAGVSFGLAKPALNVSGVYGLVRNPQVVAMGLALIGHTLVWPTWRLSGALLLYFPIAHLMVITEEEHLARAFGEIYREYQRRVPRYVPKGG